MPGRAERRVDEPQAPLAEALIAIRDLTHPRTVVQKEAPKEEHMNQLPTPAPAAIDAKNRAWRTLVQSLLVDVGAAVILAITPLLANIEWKKSYWLAVGLLAARSAVTALVSWISRKVVPPATI
jgi:uncharacterized membrane protein YcjF (UPF0283 family)